MPVNGPTVKLLSPSGGEEVAASDTLLVEWEAKHPEALPMDYRVLLSTDGGKTFRPLAVGCQDTSYIWQVGLAARNGRVRLRVVASDGFNEADDVSDDILVGDVARRVVIVQPRSGETIPEGQTLLLTAIANDLETGGITLTSSNTRWHLEGEIILGMGNDVEISDIELTTPRGTVKTPLPVGEHRLSVEVHPASGNPITHEIPIEIAADSDRDRVPDRVEIAWGEDPNDPGNRASVGPVYPFGQWHFDQQRQHTLFQIADLLAGTVWLELGLVDETGSRLSNHPIVVGDGATQKTVRTDNGGWARMELGGLESNQVMISATRNTVRGFGTCYLRVARGSPLRETVIEARGWIGCRRELVALQQGVEGYGGHKPRQAGENPDCQGLVRKLASNGTPHVQPSAAGALKDGLKPTSDR